MFDMTEEFKFLKPSKPKKEDVDGKEIIGNIEKHLDTTRAEDERASFTVLDPAKVTGKDIVALWRAELKRLSDAEKASAVEKAEADKKKET